MNIGDLQNLVNEFYQSNEKSKESLKGYFETMMKIKVAQKTINRNTKVQSDLTKKLNDLNDAINASGGQQTDEQRKQKKLLLESIKYLKEQNEQIEAQLRMHKSSNKFLNLSLAAISSTEKTLFGIGKILVKNSGYFLDQMRSVRNTERSMGIIKSQTDSFRKTLYNASVITNQIGVDTKELAQMQGQYSDLIGRNVILSEQNLTNMSEFYKASGLSLDSMTEMISLTDGMGLNINTAVSEFESLSQKAVKMGINQTKVLGKMNNILKMANKYSFKGGVDSMKKMALYSEKYKTNVDEIASLADKLFDVEGAIEMGAQLQVLGGKWAQISDPMSLMFKARNDMEGLQNDIISAASGAAQWDKATKSFKISALELHRMRGAAEMTGLSLDHLRDIAERTAKSSHIKTSIKGLRLSDEEMDLVTSMAKINDDGSFAININGKDIHAKDLYKYASEITKMVKEQESNAEKAQKAMLFDEKVVNIINSFKSTALPIFEAFDKSFSPVFNKITKFLNQEEVLLKIQKFMGHIATGIETIGKFIVTNPIGAMYATGGALLGKAVFELAKWRLMGYQLSQGFNAGVNGISAGGGVMGTGGGWKGAKGRAGKFLGKGAGIAGLAGGAMVLGSGMMEEGSDSQMWTNAAGNALSWGATGGTIGAMFGGVGAPVGAAIGALAGGGYSLYESMKARNGQSNDFIARPGQDPINFNSADTLVGLKKDGGLGKALINNTGSSSGTSTVTFDKPLIVQGEIQLKSDSKTISTIDIANNPVLQREIARMVQVQLSKNLSGGKLTSNKLA